MVKPKRGEIWLVNLNPARGAEIKKIRPAVVISSDALGTLPVKIVAPLTGWQSHFANHLWHIPVKPTDNNGLSKKSAIDTLQVRSITYGRFTKKLGVLDAHTLQQVVTALGIVVEYA